MSNFTFLKAEWPDLFEAAAKAEALTCSDARGSCFYARRALELAVHWLYKHDAALKLPYQEHLSALIHDPIFRQATGPAVFAKTRVVKDLCNLAVHSRKPVRRGDALTAAKELFHVLFWLARTYAREVKPADGLAFDPDRIPKLFPGSPQTLEQLRLLESQRRERDEKLSGLLTGKAVLDDELKRLRAEIAEAKKANSARPDTHDYSEAETRDYFIDLLLKEAGWALDQPQDREFEVGGMPKRKGKGLRGLRALGRRRQASRAGRGQAHPARRPRGPAAGEALRRLPGDAVRPAAGHLLLQRLRALAVGRCELPAAAGAGFLQEGRIGAGYPETQHLQAAGGYASPYTDFSPKGVEGVFSSRQVDEMVSILDDIRKRAAAA